MPRHIELGDCMGGFHGLTLFALPGISDLTIFKYISAEVQTLVMIRCIKQSLMLVTRHAKCTYIAMRHCSTWTAVLAALCAA